MNHPLPEDLVAYRDGELSARKRANIESHVRACVRCTEEQQQIDRLDAAVRGLERVSPSADFSTTFWRRLEQEGTGEPEPLDEGLSAWTGEPTRPWWRVWESEWFANWQPNWQVGSAIAAAASLLIFLSYFFSSPVTENDQDRVDLLAQQQRVVSTARTTEQDTPASIVRPSVPSPVAQAPQLFVDYTLLANLDKFSHFDEISTFQQMFGPDLPSVLREDPNFFMQYQLLEKMEQLQHLESVLDSSGSPEASRHS